MNNLDEAERLLRESMEAYSFAERTIVGDLNMSDEKRLAAQKEFLERYPDDAQLFGEVWESYLQFLDRVMSA